MFDNPVFVVILLVIVAALGAAAGFFAGRTKGQDMARGAKESDLNEAKAQIEADRSGYQRILTRRWCSTVRRRKGSASS